MSVLLFCLLSIGKLGLSFILLLSMKNWLRIRGGSHPTEYGKSMCYQCLPFLKDYNHKKDGAEYIS